MATAHLSVKIGKVGKGTPHAEYISRVGKYSERLQRGEKLEFTESGNMPAWAAHDPMVFWNAADEYERKNGSVYREHEISLPRELSPEQRIELVRDWVKQELSDHAYTLAIHNPKAIDGNEQPHVHIMFSDRINDAIERDPSQYFKRYNSKHPDRGGAKKANTAAIYQDRKEALQAQRGRWELLHNAYLEKYGHSSRIDMRSLKEQGIDRLPAEKMLPSESEARKRLVHAQREVNQEIPNLTKRLMETRADPLISLQDSSVAQWTAGLKKISNYELIKAHQELMANIQEKSLREYALKSVYDLNEKILLLQKKHDHHEREKSSLVHAYQAWKDKNALVRGFQKLLGDKTGEQINDQYIGHQKAQKQIALDIKKIDEDRNNKIDIAIGARKLQLAVLLPPLNEEILSRPAERFKNGYVDSVQGLSTKYSNLAKKDQIKTLLELSANKSPLAERLAYGRLMVRVIDNQYAERCRAEEKANRMGIGFDRRDSDEWER